MAITMLSYLCRQYLTKHIFAFSFDWLFYTYYKCINLRLKRANVQPQTKMKNLTKKHVNVRT